MAAVVVGTPAMAQPGGDDGLAIITVTAQKREESLQDIPISATVFSADELLKGGIEGLDDYAALTPSLTIDTGRNESNAEVNIRGVGSNVGGTQNLYGIYLDGVELTGGSSLTTGMALLDVERVEVLRGPQGTAFGRNVMAGAINLTSTTPAYEFGGSAEVRAESFQTLSLRNTLNIPLADGVAAMRISGRYSRSDGHMINEGAAGQVRDNESYLVRGSVLIEPSENFRIKGLMSYSKGRYGLSNEVPTGNLIGTARAIRDAIDAGFGGPTLPPGSLPGDGGPSAYFPDQDRRSSINFPSFEDVEVFVGIANTTLDLFGGAVSWVNVGGYISTDFNQQIDIDRTNYDIINQYRSSNSEFFSLESRLQSNGTGPFNWIAGAYYSKAEGEQALTWNSGTDARRLTLGQIPNNFVGLTSSLDYSDFKSWAVFGDLSFDLTHRLTIAGGARYNSDELSLVRPVAGRLLGVPQPATQGSLSSDKVTWRANVQYEAARDMNLYAAVSSGYRAGGLQPTNAVRPSYGPEKMMNYELGAKLMIFDRRVRANLALFKMDWTDVQITTVDRTTGLVFTDNAGKASVKGIELDLAARFGRFEVMGGLSYLDNQIDEFIDGAGYDQSGNPLPDAAKFSSSVSVQYTQPFRDNLDGFVRGTFIQTTRRLEDLIEGGIDPIQYAPGYERFDLRAGLETDGLRFEAFVENLFDRKIATGIQTAGASLAGTLVATFPRRVGVRLSVTY